MHVHFILDGELQVIERLADWLARQGGERLLGPLLIASPRCLAQQCAAVALLG